MTTDKTAHDPLEFVSSMWNRMGFTLPGMVTPTLDVDELENRINNMRAVEGWLKMNLSMLQMAIQGLDMQRAAIAAVHAMSQPLSPDQETQGGNNPFLWPWNMMSTKEEGTAAPAVAEDKPRAKRKTSTDK